MTHSQLILVAIAVVALIVAMRKIYFTDKSRMTSYTFGRVLRSEEKLQRTTDLQWHETLIAAQFTAIGQNWEVQTTLRGQRCADFPPGREVKIRYNPGKPEMAEIILK